MGQLFISGMINGVAQPVLTKVSDDLERQKRVFRKMLRFTAFVSFPAMLGLGIVSEELITITITDKWYPAYPSCRFCVSAEPSLPLHTSISNSSSAKENPASICGTP